MRRYSSCGIVAVLLCVAGTVQGQTLRSETTWGGTGSDVAYGVAVASDGGSYVTGITDSFATDQFGNPSQRIFLTRFEANGSVGWQRIWNGQTLTGGLRGPSVAIGSGGEVYVAGRSVLNGNDAVLLKFAASGTLIWERTWGGSDSEDDTAVATGSDGSVYIAGTTTSFGPGALFIVKFDSDGNLVWQKLRDAAAGMAVSVAADGSVYAAGASPRPDSIGEFDLLAVKVTSSGSLVWDRTYQAGVVVDPRAGMTVAPDGSVVIAGAIQARQGGGVVDIAALVVKIDPDGNLLFDREWGGKNGDVGAGVTVGPDNAIYVAGASTSFGAGNQDAFVVRIEASGKAGSAATWGNTGFETGGGVGLATDGTIVLAATTTAGPPYVLLSAPRKVSAVHGAISDPAGALADPSGVPSNPNLGTTVTNGSTTFSGNFEAALVRFVF